VKVLLSSLAVHSDDTRLPEYPHSIKVLVATDGVDINPIESFRWAGILGTTCM
jgi:hypothetical protein